jgi:homogentisate phytyltransferase / homogentisate geranylgeranyltransferase
MSSRITVDVFPTKNSKKSTGAMRTPGTSSAVVLVLLLATQSVIVTPFAPPTHLSPLSRSTYYGGGGAADHGTARPHAAAVVHVRASSVVAMGQPAADEEDLSRFFSSKKARMMQTNSTTQVLLAVNPPTTLSYTGPINGDHAGTATTETALATKSLPFPLVVWKFTRPHTLIGSALAIPGITALAAPTYGALWSAGPTVAAATFYAMVPSLLMNLYITGLNQVTDVEIDRVNKPYLPIPAGMLSRRNGALVCAVSLVVALTLGVAHPVYGTAGLNTALWGSAILGTLYSLPPFRLKRFPLLAAFCVVSVRGTIINAGFFAHAKAAVFGGSAATSTVWSVLTQDLRCSLLSSYFAVFGLVIALMKDVPDVLGDRMNGIRSFSVRVGPQRIFHFSRRVLSVLLYGTSAGFAKMAYTAAASHHQVGLTVGRLVVAVCALAAGTSVETKAAGVDPESPDDVFSYYMHLWKIFYASYMLLPLCR